jgi:GNAT superfamily N-acetyltransferase
MSVTIRRATSADLPALGHLGALLMRAHHDFDPHRFMAPGDNPDEGYAWFLGHQLREETSVVFVAERQGEVIGYVYAGLEPLSWRELRDACGFVHDVVVGEHGRHKGVATALMAAAIQWLRERGAPRVILWTADRNEGAQKLFTRLGFRRTMVEMTLELQPNVDS